MPGCVFSAFRTAKLYWISWFCAHFNRDKGILKNKKQAFSDDSEEKPDFSKGLILNVALVTMSNGADNIGVYMPLFASYTIFQMMIVVIVFALMIALWCLLSKKLADLPGLRIFLLRYKHIVVPVVFVILGVYIIVEAI